MNTESFRAFPRAAREMFGLPCQLRNGLAAGLLAALPLLAGCASIPSIYEQPGDSLFGEANRQTMMAQVIDPDPYYDGPMVTSGDHAAQAVERYRTDDVKQPDNIRTSDAGAGSGGD